MLSVAIACSSLFCCVCVLCGNDNVSIHSEATDRPTVGENVKAGDSLSFARLFSVVRLYCVGYLSITFVKRTFFFCKFVILKYGPTDTDLYN